MDVVASDDSVDPTIGLALAMSPGLGRFALLLGSGVSAAAGIPTGWDVVTELVRRVAALEDPGSVTPEDLVAWYAERFGAAPDYSSLLEQLAPTPAQRRDLLTGFFEPTPDEMERGKKTPTRAHRAIAELVLHGAVRVIVTTNFDRLLEQAVQALGIEPVVVATSSSAAGTIPLAHTRCTIIKVHGDYLDPSFKNTVGELDSYDAPLDVLLDRVFDDYGLVVCGWSATWDPALRNAIERCPSRRYGTYWAAHGDLAADASRLVANRAAIVVEIDSADVFFEDLSGKVQAVGELGRRAVGGVEVVTAEAKRNIPDPVNRIRLYDLAMSAVDRAVALVDFDGHTADQTDIDYMATVHRLEDATADAVAIVAAVAQFGDRPDHTDLVRQVLSRLIKPTDERLDGRTAWINLRGYPALLGMYAAGVAASASDNSALLAAILRAEVGAVGLANSFEPLPLFRLVAPSDILEAGQINRSFGPDVTRKTPVSDYLFDRMGAYLAPAARLSAHQLAQHFDEWEYLLAVVRVGSGVYPEIGRFVWRERYVYSDLIPDRALITGAVSLLAAGLFDGDPAKLEASKSEYGKLLGQNQLRYR